MPDPIIRAMYLSFRRLAGLDTRDEEKRRRYMTEYNRKHRIRIALSEQLRRYGLSFDDWTEMLFSQDYACASCGEAFLAERNATHIDHDHETGRVRGILCAGCNTGIGHFKESPKKLRKAALYLENCRALA